MPEPGTRNGILEFPSVTQYATPQLIEAIAYHGYPPGDDPGWPDSGAPSQESYAFWCSRLCGMACLKMALTARDGVSPRLFELLDGCLAYKGYTRQPDGTVRGLYYKPFTQFTAEKYGIDAEVVTELSSKRIEHELDTGRLVIASVHKEIRRPETPAPGRGGHLVLVTGYSEGRFHFRNPSGHAPAAVTASMAAGLFDSYAAHRGISLNIACT